MNHLNKANAKPPEFGLFNFFNSSLSTFSGRNWSFLFSSLETSSCDRIASFSLFAGVAVVCTWLRYRNLATNINQPAQKESAKKVLFLEARFRPIDQNTPVEGTLLGNSLIRGLINPNQDHANGPHYRKTRERVNSVPPGGVFLDAVNRSQSPQA